MTKSVIGWESTDPVPNHTFNSYLRSQDGRLFLDDVDLTQLFLGDKQDQGFGRTAPTPLEVVYLPLITKRIEEMQRIFTDVIEEINYEGQFLYAYASKANAAEEIIRTTLKAGVHHEMSSTVDVEIARLMRGRGLLTPEQLVICNGFKSASTDYAENIIRFKQEHDQLIPVIEDLGELPPLIQSEYPFDVGIRQKSYGPHQTESEMDSANSRFGLDMENMWKAAEAVDAAPNLRLLLYHAMVGSQITDEQKFVEWLTAPIDIYARLKQRYPSLSIFDFGGGMPVAMTLDFEFDYRGFVYTLLTTMQEICGRFDVPVPDVMGEFGRYTTSEHGAHLFKVITTKENASEYPWYIIDGSIMSSFPDSWALGEQFIVLPLNHLDKPFQRVKLGGITCDSDDIYPQKKSESALYLPVTTEDLYVGFFSIGAYQEMLGGVKGSKHCVLPEALELIIDHNSENELQFQLLTGQSSADVLRNLGYAAA